MTDPVAVITLVAGRAGHLHRQQQGLLAGDRLPDTYVVVAMDDPDAAEAALRGPLAGSCDIRVIRLDAADIAAGLPLAGARNLGAAAALERDAKTLVFLDVDCVPAPGLVAGYAAAVAAEAHPALHCGVVRYLAPGALDGFAESGPLDTGSLVAQPHPARPAPESGSHPSADWQLFWSLSFAVSVVTWRQLGGFSPEYVGYGGEDTDFGLAAHTAGVEVSWTGGVDAFHQYHPTQSPPVAHLNDILRNAAVFHDRWHRWPMLGWLTAFAERGLAHYDPVSDNWLAGPTPSDTSGSKIRLSETAVPRRTGPAAR